ncbi:RNA polymerase sigma factor [Pinibacter aurantiacus]|uniref:RNA polymerase subunit sigma n=1 Tax=Pinibacter aurantiacus TaxID=2851599 RepID=A0A9E2W5J6_9BACT|nr:DUF6596 domain-containing protein [Pinibacter aurantiacus]MBV4358954.1 RNA polymerase subunit sigma [Pinibacter aurantiacus]
MENNELIPHLFRTEYSKMVAVLCKAFGIEHISIAEDVVSDTFLLAVETWGQKGLPKNPVAWLYIVAKNKSRDILRRQNIFDKKVKLALPKEEVDNSELHIDLSEKNITDSQLQMIFAICHPSISAEAQIGLALNILCGFGAEEIADAFLSNKETIYKRLARAKEKLKENNVPLELPSQTEIDNRLDVVLRTMYLLFNEGYYSASQNVTLRKELCLEAMRLTYSLIENESTNTPAVNALMSIMCFHASRFEARIDSNGEIILYEDQDASLWSEELINKGKYYLEQSSHCDKNKVSKYHIEAAIAFYHTNQADTHDKWESILQLYNRLLQIEYSPIAALNRTYALSKANGKAEAIVEAEKLGLDDNHWYHLLLANLYTGIDNGKTVTHLKKALNLSKTVAEKNFIEKKLQEVTLTNA